MTTEISPPPEMVAGPDETSPHRQRSTVAVVVAVIAVLAAASLLAASTIKVGYFTQAPGSAVPLDGLIAVEGAEVFEGDGEIYFTTVRLTGEITVLEYLLALADSSVELRTSDEVLGGQTRDQQRAQNLELMDDSQEIATRVALEVLGYDVVVEAGALVTSVLEGSGSDGALEPGDVVIVADGIDVVTSPALVDVIRAKSPGDEIVLGLLRQTDGGDPVSQEVTVVLGESEGRSQLGVTITTWLDLVALPFDVNIDTASVGGPSAGLALTLAIIDRLTEGELTGGMAVATTGTIDVFGNVGPIGGAEQKAHAVRRAGIDLFIVPSANFDEALAGAGDDLQVVAVDTLQEALAVLGGQGGEAVGVDLVAAPAA